ncbi:MAG TPA: galactokinase [Verrucomicrobiae bacterium]|nr:galactokinase [Verrucomicrobiae bacterium]
MGATEVIAFFRKQFGFKPTHVVQAPGRLELLGNHTDYNQGLVLALAVDKHIYMASSPRTDGKIELTSTAFPKRESFSVGNLQKNPDAAWADYVKGVLDQLRKRNVHTRGFNAAIHADIPMGAGMSSSAALEVATALTLRHLSPYTLTATGLAAPPINDESGELPDLTLKEKLEIAKLCQAAENQFVGVQCGLLDQVSSLYGKAFHAIELDCQSNTVEHVPMVGEVAVVVANTGVKHELVGGEYNALRENCESAAKKLGAKSLRAVEAKYLAANRSKLTEREYQCAYHIVGEIQRVVFGARALRDGDFVQFGQFMFQSHESSRDFFKNSTPELDALAETARELEGCYGARLTGGGFGGATINLVHRGKIDAFIEGLAQGYKRRTGRETQPMRCEIADGAK